MITPVLADEAFLRDVAEARPGGDHFRLWWLGQSGFLVKWKERLLLLDPYLSDSLTRKYAQTDKPHIRMTGRVVDPARLTGITVATSSHSHTDHLDAETLVPLVRANPGLPLVLPEANLTTARDRLGAAPPEFVGLDHGRTKTVGGFQFTGIAAAHNDIELDALGRCCFLGYVIKFGPWTLYHSGDTLWHRRLTASLLVQGVDVMLLPINGNRPSRRVAGNLNGTEAAALAKACNARLVIPCHYEMFTFNTASPAEFEGAARQLSQRARVLRCGESWDSVQLDVPAEEVPREGARGR